MGLTEDGEPEDHAQSGAEDVRGADRVGDDHDLRRQRCQDHARQEDVQPSGLKCAAQEASDEAPRHGVVGDARQAELRVQEQGLEAVLDGLEVDRRYEGDQAVGEPCRD